MNRGPRESGGFQGGGVIYLITSFYREGDRWLLGCQSQRYLLTAYTPFMHYTSKHRRRNTQHDNRCQS